MGDVFIDVIFPVFLVALIGGVVGRRLGLAVDTFSKAVFFLFSPSLVFVSISGVSLEAGEVTRVVAVGIVVFVANAASASLWSRLRGDDVRTRAGAALAASVANQGNLGLPIARLAFGDVGLQVAVLVYVTGVVLWSSVGIAVGSMGRVPLAQALRAPFRYPTMYAASAATLVNVMNWELPQFAAEPIDTLAAASIPCMLMVLGLQFRPISRGDLAHPLSASFNRLVLGPLVAWPTAMALGLDGVVRGTVIIGAGMPTAVMVTVLASQLDARPDLAVRAVVVSSVLSLASLTVLVALLR